MARTVVVTGGAGALGQGVVQWFSNQADNVAVLDYSDEILAKAFPQPQLNHCYIACDLTDRQSCADAIGRVLREFDRIDVLANIAGGFLMGDPVQMGG